MFSVMVFAQDAELRNKAALYASNAEYEMAIPIYKLLIDKHPSEPDLYIKRGDSYVYIKKYDHAIDDYRMAFSLSPDNTELLYKLGSAYDIVNDLTNAISYFYLLSQKEPHNASPFHRLAILHLNLSGKADSALYFAERGLEIEPQNPVSYYALSMVYLNNSEYTRAIDAAKKGLNYDKNNIHLKSSLGLAYFFLKDFRESYCYFSEASTVETRDDIIYYKALTQLISNTSTKDYYFDENNKIHLMGNIQEDPKVLSKKQGHKSVEKSYVRSKRMLSDSLFSMGLKDFLSLYRNYAKDDSYTPVSIRQDSLGFFLRNKNYDSYEKEALRALQENPTNFSIYYHLAEIYNKKSLKEKHYNSIFKYYGFLNAILASGDGSDTGNAFYINDREHELEVIANLGLTLISQKTIVNKKIHYDVLTINDKAGNLIELYFNIEDIYQGINDLKNKRKGQGK